MAPRRAAWSPFWFKPNDIRAIPEIFQPREFTFGLRDKDKAHIIALKQEIAIHGELDPPPVIRLRGDGWVVAEDTTALKPTRRRALEQAAAMANHASCA